MATFIDSIVNWIKGSAQLLGWLLSSVVIPMTIWLTVLKEDVKNTIKTQTSYQLYSDARFVRIDEDFRFQTTERDRFKDQITMELIKINSSIGELRGEVRRIPR